MRTFTGKNLLLTRANDEDEGDEGDGDDDHDFLVIDTVGGTASAMRWLAAAPWRYLVDTRSALGALVVADCVGVIAGALKATFDPAWRHLYRSVLKFTRPARSDLDISMAIGVFAEVRMWAMREAVGETPFNFRSSEAR